MSIDVNSGGRPLSPLSPPTWGELMPAGQVAGVIRFVLGTRSVAFPIAQLRRWEHHLGPPETLLISAGQEQLLVEGRDLAEVRAALDLGRLSELRPNYRKASELRPGPCIHAITIEGT